MDPNNNSTHAKVEWGKSQEASTSAKNHRQLWNAETGRNSLPRGGAQMTVQYQMKFLLVHLPKRVYFLRILTSIAMRYTKYLGLSSMLGNNYFPVLSFEVSDVTEYHR